ncbi:MAG: hypothetical protein A2Y13_01780 [Planctomycetes bacterium GWC2_45_44]|nr:MAG: hypothetical protein A2Y13_01780 [Planctomycetes bacterium GWC2_45_44]HBR19662.1 hypothetical protein [Phycisphaerales bacterium]
MKSRIFSVILSVFLFTQISFAQLCSVLKDAHIGEEHTLAIDENNNLWACGGGGYARGLGVVSGNILSLQRVLDGDVNTASGYLENVVSFDAGWEHSLVATSDGFCWSFGHDSYGKLGNGSNESDSSVPVKVHGLNDDPNGIRHIVKVSAGRSGQHSLVIDSNGYPLAWGRNDSSQCASEDTNSSVQFPHLVVDSCDQTVGVYLGDEAFIVDVEAGVSHSLALSDEGFVYEWGDSIYAFPHKVRGENGTGFLSNIIDIATCGCSLAVDSNHNVWYWYTGGNPTKVTDGDMQTQSGYLENIVKVAAGYGFCAAIDANGNAWEWNAGSGSPKKITNGQQISSSGYLEDIIALDVGYYDQRIAIDSYGRGWGWGSNRGGALGIGDDSTPTEPAEMLCAEISPSVELSLSYEIQGSEPNCAQPFIGYGVENNYLVFEIYYANPITDANDPNYVGTISDVNIINELPLETTYYSSDPCGMYNSTSRTVTWHIGDLSPGEDGILTLTVKVNEYAKPCGEIINFCQLTADSYYAYDDVNVPVCPYGGEIIFVNDDANGFDNGTDWQNAYTDLQNALSQARSNCTEITAIWIAGGTYKPVETTGTNYQYETFELVDSVALMGHFAGDESSSDQRNFADANNETILNGRIGTNYYDAVYYVLKAENITAGLVDGFTIKNAYQYGMFMDNAAIGIANCKFSNNYSYGVYAGNYSYPDIHNCLFMDNSSYSVYATTSQPDISYCVFDGNDTTSYGLYIASYSVSNITNSDFQNHNSGAVYGGNATINVSDCNLSLNGTAISGSSGTVTISNCSLSENSTAIQSSSATLNVSDCNLYSNYYAIQGYSGTADIENCKLFQNNYYGIEGSDLNLTVKHTIFEDNAENGIRLSSGCNLDIQNSVVRNSGSQGIYLTQNSSTQIINNWINNNGDAGIYLEYQVGIPLIRNNTIYDNATFGIERNSTGAEPNILNCIIFGNDTNDIYRPSGTFSKVKYCLLQRTYTGTGNITGDPCFANPSNENDLHIAKESICKDAGYLYGVYGENETDIDGEARVKNGRIEIGGDECYISPADYDDSGIVNFLDYAPFANNWQTTNANISLDDDNDVDVCDLALFCEDWLWQNATETTGWMLWTAGQEEMMIMSMPSESTTIETSLMLSTAAESIAKQPNRLKTKFQKFYDITPTTTISAKQRELESLKAQRAERIAPSKAIEPMSLSSNLAIESAESVEPIEDVFDVNETLDWLDDLWTSGELAGSMTESEFETFRNSIENYEE